MKRLSRPVYIAWRLIESLGQTATRLFNAIVLGGSTRQSTSARMYIEKWPKGEARIDAFFKFFTGKGGHCRQSWEAEVNDALYTLRRNDAFGGTDVRVCWHGSPKPAIVETTEDITSET